jgi:hypothetical protein
VFALTVVGALLFADLTAVPWRVQEAAREVKLVWAYTHKEFNMKKTWLFLACVLYSAPALFAQNAGDFQTELTNGQVAIIGYSGSAEDVRIPDRINGRPVMSIGDEAFAWAPLTSVTIPNSVTSIGDFAFYETPLTSVTIPNSVTSIGDGAFAWAPLTSVTIPNSVTSIGEGAFADTSLTSVTIPNSVRYIGDGAFVGCSSLTTITADVRSSSFSSADGVLFSKDMKTLVAYPGGKSPHYTIPDSVTSIGNFAFAETSLTSVRIPNSVISIGDGAFYETPLTSVTIPDSVTSIGYSAFAGASLTSVTIPNSVTSIGEDTFHGTSLTSVTIPNSVTSIGDRAFYETPLTSVTIPDSVTFIGEWAFAETPLTRVTIPNSVTSIGEGAFVDCSRLTTITVGVQNASFSSVDDILFSKDMKTLVVYPGRKSPNYSIPNSVTSIGDYAFYGTGLTSITIPDSVTSIGDYAFYGTSLTSVTIPDSVTSIGAYAFSWMPLTNITIPNSVTSIGNFAFADTSLTSVTIPNSVTSIGEDAFDYGVEIIRADSGSEQVVSEFPVITVVNNTGYTFYYVYISPSDSDTWGRDVLGDRVLYDGQSFRYALPSSGTWDIQAEDSDEDTYTRRLVITADTTLRLTLEDLD